MLQVSNESFTNPNLKGQTGDSQFRDRLTLTFIGRRISFNAL